MVTDEVELEPVIPVVPVKLLPAPPMMVVAPCAVKVALFAVITLLLVTLMEPVGAATVKAVFAVTEPLLVIPIAPPAELTTEIAPTLLLSRPSLLMVAASMAIPEAVMEPAAVLAIVPPTALSCTAPAGVNALPMVSVCPAFAESTVVDGLVMVPAPFTVRLEGPVIVRLFTVADTLPSMVAVPVCKVTVGPLTDPVARTVRVLPPGVVRFTVLPVTVAPALTFRLPPLVRANELPAPAPAELDPRFKFAAVPVMVAEAVVLAVMFVASVEAIEMPPAPEEAVNVVVLSTPVEVIPPALAVKLSAVPAVKLPVILIDPAFDVRLTVGAAILARAPE